MTLTTGLKFLMDCVVRKNRMSENSPNAHAGRQCRLIYKSQTSWDLLSNDSLLQLAEASTRNNEAAGITGLLALSGETFLQVLEGPVDAVNELYLKIAKDKRHGDLRLLLFEQISEGIFTDWSMHVVDLHDLPAAQREFLAGKYPAEDGSILIPEDDRLALSLLLDARQVILSETDRAKA